MEWDGSGGIDRDFYPEDDRDNSIKILASKFEDLFESQTSLIENCYTLDSQTTPTQSLNMASNKIIGVTDGSATKDAINFGQLDTVDTKVDANTAAIAAIGTIGYIEGGIVSNDAVTPDSLIDISAVSCRASDDSLNIDVVAKTDLDITANASWASGTAPTLTSITIYVFAVYDATTPYYILDVDAVGTNISPVNRRVGALLTDSSADIIPFISREIDGGGYKLVYDVQIQDFNAVPAGTSAELITISAPPSMSAEINFSARGFSATTGFITTETSQADTAPTLTYNEGLIVDQYAENIQIHKNMIVDSSSQIRTRWSAVDTTMTLYILTNGFTDERKA